MLVSADSERSGNFFTARGSRESSEIGVEVDGVNAPVMGLIWNSTSASGPRQLKALVKSFLFENRKLPEESVANSRAALVEHRRWSDLRRHSRQHRQGPTCRVRRRRESRYSFCRCDFFAYLTERGYAVELP